VLVVHSEILYVPVVEGWDWEEVVVRNVLHYEPIHPLRLAYWYIMYFIMYLYYNPPPPADLSSEQFRNQQLYNSCRLRIQTTKCRPRIQNA
jgi:hypothetical protein